jgi:hypothetical protein
MAQGAAGEAGETVEQRPTPAAPGAGGEEEMPRVLLTRRQIVAFGVFVLLVVGFLYFVLPQLAGVGTAVHHLEGGDKWWIAVGVVFELLSFAGYVVLFRSVFVVNAEQPGRIGWRESYEITMAGLVATRLFAAAGAGGVALTAWALRRAAGGPPDGGVHRAAVLDLRGLAAARRDRAGCGDLPRRRLVRDHDRARDRRRHPGRDRLLGRPAGRRSRTAAR